MRPLITASLAAFLCLIASSASAAMLCGEREKFLAHLAKNHQEAPTSIGQTSSGQIIEVLTSKKGSWSILVTSPTGNSCLVATGEAWEEIKRDLPKAGEKRS